MHLNFFRVQEAHFYPNKKSQRRVLQTHSVALTLNQFATLGGNSGKNSNDFKDKCKNNL